MNGLTKKCLSTGGAGFNATVPGANGGSGGNGGQAGSGGTGGQGGDAGTTGHGTVGVNGNGDPVCLAAFDPDKGPPAWAPQRDKDSEGNTLTRSDQIL